MEFTELKFQRAETKIYLGSPSILGTRSGRILAVHDYFGPGSPRDHEGEEFLTSVYGSDDDGVTWRFLGDIPGAFWSSLFELGGAIYLFGVSRHYGGIVIRASHDDGMTWTRPMDENSGLLFRGGAARKPPNYHCAPVPVLIKNGRIFRAFEDCDPPVWGSGFQSLVISAPVDSDLLGARNWTMSNKIAFDPAWIPGHWLKPSRPGWLEGNVIESPSGEIRNILRFNSKPEVDIAAVVKVGDDGRRITFDPETGFIDFPGGMTKFTIRKDPASGLYLTLCNNNTDPESQDQRNVLSLFGAGDLVHWRHIKTLIEDDSELAWKDSVRLTGFQYVDWQFDGEDIIYLVRTAYNGAHNFHDANRITFHRLNRYKTLLTGFESR